MEMISVYSDRVDKIGYDEATQTLVVEWKRNSKTSSFTGVPPDVARRTMNAPSIGQALRQTIEGVYTHEYL
jgi:hypothetical protein